MAKTDDFCKKLLNKDLSENEKITFLQNISDSDSKKGMNDEVDNGSLETTKTNKLDGIKKAVKIIYSLVSFLNGMMKSRKVRYGTAKQNEQKARAHFMQQ